MRNTSSYVFTVNYQVSNLGLTHISTERLYLTENAIKIIRLLCLKSEMNVQY